MDVTKKHKIVDAYIVVRRGDVCVKMKSTMGKSNSDQSIRSLSTTFSCLFAIAVFVNEIKRPARTAKVM